MSWKIGHHSNGSMVVRDKRTNQPIAEIVKEQSGWAVTWTSLPDLNTRGLRTEATAIGFVYGVLHLAQHAEEPPQVALFGALRGQKDTEGSGIREAFA